MWPVEFKSWLQLETVNSKKDAFIRAVGDVFGDCEQHVTTTTWGFVLSVSQGIHQINLCYYADPARVQIGFFYPDSSLRPTQSPKDVKTGQTLGRGTMSLVHRLNRLVAKLAEAKIKVMYNATDGRRDDLYARRLQQHGFTPSSKTYKHFPGKVWNFPSA